MQLSVPRRAVADNHSFPVEAADVERWLSGLDPRGKEADARAVFRGLKHSNRLQNDARRRRAVLECFLPVLTDLRDQLVEQTRAQPMPLTREFARTGALLDGLLREETITWKILVSDADKPNPEDARRAMLALVRRAEIFAQGYRRLPASLIADAELLFQFAESAQLLEPARDGEHSLADLFRYILMIQLADPHQIRARQLPLALDFLRDAAPYVRLNTIEHATGKDRLAMVLGEGARPAATASLLIGDPERVRVFSLDALVARTSRQIARTPMTRVNTLGVETLERQTLGRLHAALSATRSRRSARATVCSEQPVLFGHKEIATRLWFDAGRLDPSDTLSPSTIDDEWTVHNRSLQGVCLSRRNVRQGSVQVGELVALDAEDDRQSGPRDTTLLGTVRWMRADDGDTLTLGVEFLARGVMPVSVARRDADSRVTEPAMIIACKVKQSVVQTILLPPYLYDTGETLTATQIVSTERTGAGHGRPDERTRDLILTNCLQINGLYGHFLLSEQTA